jgi:protein-S-isoprenylcysteine O-methyltransferase Ste14
VAEPDAQTQPHAPWYRGARGEYYVVAQVLLFALVVLGPRTVPGWPAWSTPWARTAAWLGVPLMLAGAALALGGVLRLGSNLTALPYPRDCANLVESGPYAIVRHPIYSGLILGATGYALWVNGWLTLGYALLLFAFFDVKSRREEKWLLEKFGAPYAEYRTRVHKLIPWVY